MIASATLALGAGFQDRTKDEDHKTWGIRGAFGWELWEDGSRNYAVHHQASSLLLRFCSSPAECRAYIDSGQAMTDYLDKASGEVLSDGGAHLYPGL
jgi:hypothetical protein